MTATGPKRVRRSSGVIIAPLGDEWVVYDRVTETAHRLRPLGGRILQAAASGPTSMDLRSIDPGRDMSTGESTAVDDALSELRSLGLVDRLTELEDPLPWPGSHGAGDGRLVGPTYCVLDDRVAFRSTSHSVLESVDTVFGCAAVEEPPTTFLDVDAEAEGAVVVQAADEWRFPSRAAFLAQVVDVVNEYAARSMSVPVLHAGAVRTPDGRTLLFPGRMDAGKSTLTAALVRAGCDYLGDESIGIRPGTLHAVAYPKPFTLDPTSRELLRLPAGSLPQVPPHDVSSDVRALVGDVGPIDGIILAAFDPQRRADRRLASPPDAIRLLMENTLNLERSGQKGLETLCSVAEHVPVETLVHGDAVALAAELIGDGPGVSSRSVSSRLPAAPTRRDGQRRDRQN